MGRHSFNKEGTIEIVRTSQYVNRWRSYFLYIDGVEVASIKDGERIAFSVEPGSHTVRTRISWLWSNCLDVRVASSEKATLEISCTKFRYWHFLVMLGICFLGVGTGGVIAGKVGAAIGSGIGWLVYANIACRPHIHFSGHERGRTKSTY